MAYEDPIEDGWYMLRWRDGDPRVFAAMMYNDVLYDTLGNKLDTNEITYVRHLGDLIQENISTLKKEDA